MFIANNEMPGLQHLDGAIRRRMWVAPMGPTIREELRDTAKAARILEHERDGILSLMVWGCREAMKDGGLALLQPPQAIVDMTAGYAAEQDTVAAWLADCTVPNGAAPLVHGADCLASYRRWCEPSRRIGRNQFYDRLGEIATRSGDREHAWFGGFELRETGPDRLPGGGK
jgi:phage/plasmid-associated DNA primase